MAPKHPRAGVHSRTSSATRLGTNLQFTQKDPTIKQPQPTQSKKNPLVYTHDAHGRSSPFQKVTSSHRIASKDQLSTLQPKRSVYPSKANGQKPKKGFTIASSPSDEADDDEWVSSESGAVTPNHVEGFESGAESELIAEQSKLLETRLSLKSDITTRMVEEQEREKAKGAATPIPRVDTARPTNLASLASQPRGKLPAEPELDEPIRPPSQLQQSTTSQLDKRVDPSPMVTEPSSIDTRAAVPRPPNKRHSTTRPPSTHSIASRNDSLRPHPLIRGQSFGLPSNKLAPLAVTSDVVSAQLSTTPPVNIEQSMSNSNSLSASPTTTYTGSPSSPSTLHQSLHQMPLQRRTSVSSARSVATLPALREPPRSAKDRNRTFSALSSSSSSAAISSLAHIPATRPPSPQRLSVVFPPPSHPQFHTAGVHSLLPPPYLTNHLTTLAHRTPLREAYDRIRRAKFDAGR